MTRNFDTGYGIEPWIKQTLNTSIPTNRATFYVYRYIYPEYKQYIIMILFTVPNSQFFLS